MQPPRPNSTRTARGCSAPNGKAAPRKIAPSWVRCSSHSDCRARGKHVSRHATPRHERDPRTNRARVVDDGGRVREARGAGAAGGSGARGRTGTGRQVARVRARARGRRGAGGGARAARAPWSSARRFARAPRGPSRTQARAGPAGSATRGRCARAARPRVSRARAAPRRRTARRAGPLHQQAGRDSRAPGIVWSEGRGVSD
jgi:hypothetical protein